MFGTILAAILPSLIESFRDVTKAASNKWIGISVDDQIKLEQSQVSKLEALSKLDNPYGTPSQWVIDLRASFRYIAAGASILAGMFVIGYAFTSIADKDAAYIVGLFGADLIGIPFAFVFGDRLAINMKAFKK